MNNLVRETVNEHYDDTEFDGLDDFLPPLFRSEPKVGSNHGNAPIPKTVHKPKRRYPDWRLTNSLYMMRAVKGMTQTDLGTIVGVTRQTIGSIEQRRHEPTLSLALAIAEALDVPVNDLFHLQRPAFHEQRRRIV